MDIGLSMEYYEEWLTNLKWFRELSINNFSINQAGFYTDVTDNMGLTARQVKSVVRLHSLLKLEDFISNCGVQYTRFFP